MAKMYGRDKHVQAVDFGGKSYYANRNNSFEVNDKNAIAALKREGFDLAPVGNGSNLPKKAECCGTFRLVENCKTCAHRRVRCGTCKEMILPCSCGDIDKLAKPDGD